MLTAQLEEGRAELENAYTRVVGAAGNVLAQQLVNEIFEVCDRKWRGLGPVPRSGLRMKPAFSDYDAEARFDLADIAAEEPAECISAQILQGLKRPPDCPAFGSRCTPESPLGAPMVSAEGACAAYYHYRRRDADVLVSIGGN
jgi:hydrogenase expression/formation protein HypD